MPTQNNPRFSTIVKTNIANNKNFKLSDGHFPKYHKMPKSL